MKLTPLDIRKQDFDRSLRGYSVEEVESFLEMVADQWEELESETRRAKNRAEELEQQMSHVEKVEDALQDALSATRENAEQHLENARDKAENIVERAEAKAERITAEAEKERNAIQQEVHALEQRQQRIASRLGAFLQSELEMLSSYKEGDRFDSQAAAPPSAPAEEHTPAESESAASEIGALDTLVDSDPAGADTADTDADTSDDKQAHEDQADLAPTPAETDTPTPAELGAEGAQEEDAQKEESTAPQSKKGGPATAKDVMAEVGNVFGGGSSSADESTASDSGAPSDIETAEEADATDEFDFSELLGDAEDETADDTSDEPATTDFASMFEGSEDEPDDAVGAFDIPEPEAEEANDDDGNDDLERAMRSLFPVLEEKAGGTRASSSSPSSTSSSSEEADTSALDTRTSRPSESQFEAIKRDVQQRESKQKEASSSKNKSKRTEDEDEASTEEIEKIWSILEDMD
jgi:DivIVA domain-containing protein